MTFDKLIGQQEVKHFLLESIRADRVGHAYLFNGVEGIGRKTFAECFARYITCQNGSMNPCGKCESCTLSITQNNPDIIWFRKDEKKATIGVKEIRSVQDYVATSPSYSKYKVIIFENAEKMTLQAQNALLKVLEEPPVYVVMILISSNNSQILDTVKSRTIKVDFKRYSNKEIIDAFRSKYPKSDISDVLLCEYADGIMGRALSITNSDDYVKMCADIIGGISSLCSGRGIALCEFEALIANNAKQKELFFFILLSIFRDVMVVSRYGKEARVQNAQEVKNIYNLCDKIDYHKAKKCVEIVNHTWQTVNKNVYYKIASDLLAVKLQEVLYD